MESIYLNYKDVQFLLGCTMADAKFIIYKYMDYDDKKNIVSSACVKSSHFVNHEKIDIRYNSPFSGLHGNKQICYIISQMRGIGISDTMKHDLLEDITNIVRGGLYGKWASLKRILTKDQISNLEDSLKRRQTQYFSAKNKIPKNLLKYVKEEY